VEINGNRVRFTHPLFASTCRDMVAPQERRRMHQRLASVATDETERARHLGWSTLGPDEETAAYIAKVAMAAADRAAVATAADLALLAAELTPAEDVDARTARFCTAAALIDGSGDRARAEQVLRPVLADLEPGPGRARCLVALAPLLDVDASMAGLHEARNQPGLDPAAALEIEINIANNNINRADFVAARELGSLETSAEAAGRADLAMQIRYTVGNAELVLGVRDLSSARWSRMIADSPNAPLAYHHPDLVLGWEANRRPCPASAGRG
jgi:hypothetical protein